MSEPSNITVRYDDVGMLDEIVATGAQVHLERMDDDWFCLIVEQGDRRLLVKVGTTKRGRVRATIYADEVA